jgi:lysylphosphatidylglycerol synthetase-like protein (DUF2156 family)
MFAGATEFVALSPNLPIIERNMDPGDLTGLLNAFLVIAVAVSAILAVIMIAIGGFKYMTTESVFAISGAKEQIANAIIGLLIVLSAVLIMYTINPKIVQLDVFEPSSVGQ